ncbi:MAG TPA: aminodeoxychorismate/anthranilate synthase component II [Acidimicrobiales bacterium]|nr:aminodeoxychorismate/anthranilate synthase component II [Acidimicrobiales bacterium]
MSSILVVDNYDSFVYNLVQYLGELGASVHVARNDEVTVEDVAAGHFDGVLISPGPGHPREAGNCLDIIHYCARASLPLLGVCLGHQALAEAFGGNVVVAPELVHGRASAISHDGTGLFAGVAPLFAAGRYHSLVVEEATLPARFVVTARANGLIMGVRHADLPLEGVQFHPESVLTEDGYILLANWLETCGQSGALGKARVLSERFNELRRALPEPVSAS